MKQRIVTHLCLMIACLWLAPVMAISPLPFESAQQEARFQSLTADLRCVLCQNQSLADSNAPIAQDLRQQVFEQMQAGKSDDEIKAYLVDRYGDFVLYDPPFNAQNALLWLLPPLIFLIAAFVLWRNIRQRATLHTPNAARDSNGIDNSTGTDTGEEIW